MLQNIKERDITVKADTGKISKKLDVFYNPVMKYNNIFLSWTYSCKFVPILSRHPTGHWSCPHKIFKRLNQLQDFK